MDCRIDLRVKSDRRSRWMSLTKETSTQTMNDWNPQSIPKLNTNSGIKLNHGKYTWAASNTHEVDRVSSYPFFVNNTAVLCRRLLPFFWYDRFHPLLSCFATSIPTSQESCCFTVSPLSRTLPILSWNPPISSRTCRFSGRILATH